MKIRTSIIAAAILSTAACASYDGPQVVTVDPVVATKARIAGEQSAGREAKQVCGELGLQTNASCLNDIAHARLGTDSRTALPTFTSLPE